MSWVSVANIDTRYGVTRLQYDDSSTDYNRPCRVYFELYSGSSIYVDFRDFTVNGSNLGTKTVTGSGTLWSGSLSGNFSVSYYCNWSDIGYRSYSGSGDVPAGGTPPSGLSVSLIDYGPDWADISTSISSWGTPSSSATRYIEAAVLGSSTYGNPYKYKTATAVMNTTLHVDNTGGGNLTIVPNTQYRVGGYATNKTRSASTVGATFATLPAVPVVSAVDQGHGVISFTVTHANEGSAYTVTDEYSADGGTTWTAISGGAFSLTLSTQTEVIVRRSSTAGDSVATITVVPQFDVGIYASANGKTVKVTKVYAPSQGSSPVAKKVAKIYASVNGKTKLVYEDPS